MMMSIPCDRRLGTLALVVCATLSSANVVVVETPASECGRGVIRHNATRRETLSFRLPVGGGGVAIDCRWQVTFVPPTDDERLLYYQARFASAILGNRRCVLQKIELPHIAAFVADREPPSLSVLCTDADDFMVYPSYS